MFHKINVNQAQIHMFMSQQQCKSIVNRTLISFSIRLFCYSRFFFLFLLLFKVQTHTGWRFQSKHHAHVTESHWYCCTVFYTVACSRTIPTTHNQYTQMFGFIFILRPFKNDLHIWINCFSIIHLKPHCAIYGMRQPIQNILYRRCREFSIDAIALVSEWIKWHFFF